MKILKPTPESFQEAVTILQNRGIVAVPTETVYGLAADATHDEALKKIYKAKNRPATNPLIIHLPEDWKSLKKLEQMGWTDLKPIPKELYQQLDLLAQKFWPGPLSLILPKGEKASGIASAGLPTLAFRVPDHPVFQELLKGFSSPLAAPSANKANSISPTTAADVKSELENDVQLCLDGGACQVGVESTIVGVSLDRKGLQVFRYGGLSHQVLENFLQAKLQSPPQNKTLAPGMMKKHYAPKKGLTLLAPEANQGQIDELLSTPHIGLLIFKEGEVNQVDVQNQKSGAKVRTISDAWDGQFSCSKLYETLREMDSDTSLEKLYVWPKNIKEQSLWATLLDRLSRAAQS